MSALETVLLTKKSHFPSKNYNMALSTGPVGSHEHVTPAAAVAAGHHAGAGVDVHDARHAAQRLARQPRRQTEVPAHSGPHLDLARPSHRPAHQHPVSAADNKVNIK